MQKQKAQSHTNGFSSFRFLKWCTTHKLDKNCAAKRFPCDGYSLLILFVSFTSKRNKENKNIHNYSKNQQMLIILPHCFVYPSNAFWNFHRTNERKMLKNFPLHIRSQCHCAFA